MAPVELYFLVTCSLWNSLGQNTGVGSVSLQGDLPDPGIESRSPALQEDFLSADPQGKPFLVTQTIISLACCSLMERYSSFKHFCSYGTLDIWDVFGIFLTQKLACKTNFHEVTLFFLPSLFSFLLPFLPFCLPSFL